jgi:multidrug efflux system membrane fusion protein
MTTTTSTPHFLRWWAWLIGILAVVLTASIAWPLVTHGQAQTTARARRGAGGREGGRGGSTDGNVPVAVAQAQTGNMGVYLSELGTATALQTVTVHSRVDGQLLRVDFKEGQLVRRGDLLAEIDPRPFQVQLTQAEGQKSKDEAALANARRDLERYQVLLTQDAISRQQLDTQAAAVDQDAAAIETDQGQIEAARLNLTYSRITSPITGRVGLRIVDPGNIVHASDQNGLVVITERQPIAVVFTIAQDNLPTVLRQQRSGVQLPVDAYDRDLTTKLASGMLASIDSQIDPSTGTIKLKASFNNEQETLFPNQFVNVRLLVDTLRNVVIVPAAAVQHGPDRTFVYVVKPDDTVEMRSVQVRLTEADRAALQSGVNAGETVVTDGVDKLQPGSHVTRRASAASTGDRS